MCNLYRMSSTIAEVARTFRAIPDHGLNVTNEINPGYAALVVAESRVRSMTWGFPIGLIGLQDQPLKPRPVSNTRADKLTSPFWRASFERRRCLVPVSNFFEAEGQSGRRTRAWLSVPGENLFAFAGIWFNSETSGQYFSIVTTEANPAMASIHDRMPVIIAPDNWARWQLGSPDQAKALCLPWSGGLTVERTAEPWSGR